MKHDEHHKVTGAEYNQCSHTTMPISNAALQIGVPSLSPARSPATLLASSYASIMRYTQYGQADSAARCLHCRLSASQHRTAPPHSFPLFLFRHLPPCAAAETDGAPCSSPRSLTPSSPVLLSSTPLSSTSMVLSVAAGLSGCCPSAPLSSPRLRLSRSPLLPLCPHRMPTCHLPSPPPLSSP